LSTLTVFKFANAGGAEQAVIVVDELQKQQLVNVLDYAVVSWPTGKKKPKTRQAVDTASKGALDGTFWGLLFGLLFFVPLLGAALGAAFGAISGAFSDIGIDDDFINNVKGKVTEGTSAIFLLTDGAVIERVAQAFKELPPHELIGSNLSVEQEAKLNEVFAQSA
jgi:uncharacterized membrane protein